MSSYDEKAIKGGQLKRLIGWVKQSIAGKQDKISTKQIGNNYTPVYFNYGNPVASNGNRGNSTKPLFLKDGVLTECADYQRIGTKIHVYVAKTSTYTNLAGYTLLTDKGSVFSPFYVGYILLSINFRLVERERTMIVEAVDYINSPAGSISSGVVLGAIEITAKAATSSATYVVPYMFTSSSASEGNHEIALRISPRWSDQPFTGTIVSSAILVSPSSAF